MAAFDQMNDNESKEEQAEIMAIENSAQSPATLSLNDAEKATSESAQRKAEALLVRRIDMLILPLLALSIMVGYLDRSNIGNAAVLGMEESLGLSAQQFYNVVMMFCKLIR